jgi:very-short-patch-repair endonuclease
MTDAERFLWSKLRNRRFANFKFRRQVPLGPFIADFVCFERQLIIELDVDNMPRDASMMRHALAGWKSTDFELSGFGIMS